MPFSKRKSGRGPLQRLSDQRRSLVLGGLAVGAVGAAIFRRKRRGEEAEFETFQFETSPTTLIVVEPGEPAASEPEITASEPELVAAEPELVDEPRPINAAPTDEIPALPEPTPAPSSTPEAPPSTSEPATGELNAEEASVLAVLAQAGRTDDDRTAIAVATSLERETGDVADVLRKLGAEGVVSGDLQTSSGEEIWAVTERGVRRLGAQS
jgi:hypothetical protein